MVGTPMAPWHSNLKDFPTPVVLLSDSSTRFLYHLMSLKEAPSITVAICCSREMFLQRLSEEAQGGDGPAVEEEQTDNDLASNTLAHIARLKSLSLAFCSDLTHARAFIASLSCSAPASTKDGCHRSPIFAILDPISVHQKTHEFSAQGISKTLALAVEMSIREGAKLILCQCSTLEANGDVHSGDQAWSAHVPLLNMGTLDSRPHDSTGVRNVRIDVIARRWFSFVQQS